MLKLVRVCELEPWERYNVLHYPLVACADPEIFPEGGGGPTVICVCRGVGWGGPMHIFGDFLLQI